MGCFSAMINQPDSSRRGDDSHNEKSSTLESCKTEIGSFIPTINAVSQRGRGTYHTIDQPVKTNFREEIEAVIRRMSKS